MLLAKAEISIKDLGSGLFSNVFCDCTCGYFFLSRIVSGIMQHQQFCLQNIQPVVEKLASCRQTWYSLLENEAQQCS
jgi:hypothetical protein